MEKAMMITSVEVCELATFHVIVSQISILLNIVLLNLICTKSSGVKTTLAAVAWSCQAFPTNSTSKMRVEFGGMRHDPVQHKGTHPRLTTLHNPI
jgi:hypothetical protein